MIDLAIIDDEFDAAKSTKNLLSSIDNVGIVEVYDTFESFFHNALSGNQYDVVLMDINFKCKDNGIDYSSILFKEFPKIKIIFVTGFLSDYVSDIFIPKINLAGIIEKPVDSNKLKAIIDKIESESMSTNKELLTLENKHTLIALPLNEIIYVECSDHRIIIHSTDKNYSFYCSLNEVEKQLPKKFVHCHRSFIVNLAYVKQIGNHTLLLCDKTDASIPISRTLYKKVQNAFWEYLGKDNKM